MKLKIKEIRTAQGLSQTELALKSGVTRATIWTLETRPSSVTTTKTLAAIAAALKVPVDDLIFAEGDK